MLGNTILGGGFSSRLYKDLRVKTGYVYNVASSFDWARTRASYSVAFGADAVNVPKAIALTLSDLQAMQTTPVGKDELRQAKAQTLRQLSMSQDSVDSIAGLYLRYADLGLPLNTATLAAQHYYDATPAIIQQAFQKWLRPGDLAVVVRAPAKIALVLPYRNQQTPGALAAGGFLLPARPARKPLGSTEFQQFWLTPR